MRKLKISVLFLLVAMIFASCWATAAEAILPPSYPNYFPLAVGNQWNYLRNNRGTLEKLLVNVTGRMQPPGSTAVVFQLNNYNGKSHWVGQNGTGVVGEYVGNVDSRSPYIWYMFNSELGKSWTMQIDTNVPGVIIGSDGAILTIISRNELVKVPAGLFSTVHIRFQTGVCDAGITDEWFAPGVGLVKRMETSFVGAITTELVQAIINSVVIGNRL